jgi:hypothetical protein
MGSRSLALFFCFLCMLARSMAQQACKASEITIGVISGNGDSFRGLAAQDFAAATQKKPVVVKSLAFDDGPRRVLFVVESGKHLPAESQRVAHELLQAMVDAGRPQDSFALMIARGPGQGVKFGEDRSTLAQALSRAGDSKGGKDPGVLDAVMEGIESFGEPQSGDAIVLIAADTEGNHKANAKTVAKALDQHRIRLFGLALGPITARSSVASGTSTSTTGRGLAQVTPGVGEFVYDTGDENFFPLTTNSGGLVLVVINGAGSRSYNMDDVRVRQEIRQKGVSLFNMVSSFYRMQIEPPQLARPEGWTLKVNDDIRKHAPAMFLLYPRELGPC